MHYTIIVNNDDTGEKYVYTHDKECMYIVAGIRKGVENGICIAHGNNRFITAVAEKLFMCAIGVSPEGATVEKTEEKE